MASWIDNQLQSPVRLTKLATLFDQLVTSLNTADDDYPHSKHVATASNLWFVCCLLQRTKHNTLTTAQMESVQITKAKALVLLEVLNLYTDETPLEQLWSLEDCLHVTVPTNDDGGDDGLVSWEFTTNLTLNLDKAALLEEEAELLVMANTPIPATTEGDQRMILSHGTATSSTNYQHWSDVQSKIRQLWGTEP